MPPKEPKEPKVTFKKLLETFQTIRSTDPLRYAVAIAVDPKLVQGKNANAMAANFIALMSRARFSRSVKIAVRRRKVNFFLSIFKCGYSTDPKFVEKCDKLYAEALKQEADAKREAAATKAANAKDTADANAAEAARIAGEDN